MIDNQEKVHTQLHKFDKIICDNINEANVKPLYEHNINVVHTGVLEMFTIQIINDSIEPFTLPTLREYLTANNFNLNYQGYPITGSYGRGKTLMILDNIICQNSNTVYLEGMYFEFSIASDGSLNISNYKKQESLSADYYYKVTDHIVQLQ